MSIRVLTEYCTGCRRCALACSTGAISMADGVAVIGDACTLCGACAEECSFDAIELTRPRGNAVAPDAARGVWVFAEQRHGQVHGVAFELLGRGRGLADELGCPLTAVIFGERVESAAGELIARGADTVYALEHPSLAH